ncbi:hypothetical protein GCM10022225_77640 [Plantactinospora mayteni]|uniref:Uncharacterized protein n=1 Tax=Plantactinospora mayteni TaxID=566021 RepID=A0ABQ4F2Q5_9ACTN|nr:hypothetical protein Pma05_77700 [Plantactinospora mayteni]
MHYRFVSLWEAIWRIGAPLVVVGSAAVAVSVALSDPPEKFSRPRGWQWAWVGLWLMTAGEAAFGNERSWFERAWKGATALLFAVAVTGAVWRHYRWRRHARQSDRLSPPVARPPRSDS